MSKRAFGMALALKKRMAHGGTVSPEMNETTVRPDKGYGKIIMINDHEEEPEQALADGGQVANNAEPSTLEKIMKKVRSRHMGK